MLLRRRYWTTMMASCHFRTSLDVVARRGLPYREPRRFQRRGSSRFPPSTPEYTSAGFADDRTDDSRLRRG